MMDANVENKVKNNERQVTKWLLRRTMCQQMLEITLIAERFFVKCCGCILILNLIH